MILFVNQLDRQMKSSLQLVLQEPSSSSSSASPQAAVTSSEQNSVLFSESIFELWLNISPSGGPLSLVLPADRRWRTEDGHVVHGVGSEHCADLLFTDPMFR